MATPSYGYLDRIGAEAVFFPRPDHEPPPAGAEDLALPVAPGVELAARFYPGEAGWPTVLYFHGNGEVASDHDGIAPLYHRIGLGLLVVEFRGYGRSTGHPSCQSLVDDAVPVAAWFHALLDERGFAQERYVMGRSLGSHPALEIAANRPAGFRGLVIESGAGDLRRLLQRFGARGGEPEARALAAAHEEKLRRIRLPTLIIHGADDDLVPLAQATWLQGVLGEHAVELTVIPGAGHNDLLWLGREAYFESLRRFTGS